MSYIVEKMNIDSLEMLFVVMKDLKLEAEITGYFDHWELDWNRSIDGVSSNYYEKIIDNLIRLSFLSSKSYIGEEMIMFPDGIEYCQPCNKYLIYKKEGFDDFYNEVVVRINKLKSLNQKKNYPIENDIKGIVFDEETSVLHIGSYNIEIDLRGKKTIASDILSFFKNDFNIEIDYIDIAEHMGVDKERYLKDEYYLTIYRHCKDINEKIQKQTKLKIEDFFEKISASQKGSIKVNKKYL